MLLIALVIGFIILPFLTLVGYLVVSNVKRGIEEAEKEGQTVWWGWRAAAWICGLIAYPGDLWWNLTFGSVIFREFPLYLRWPPKAEITFTSRVKRHYHESSGDRRRIAEKWFTRLNRMWKDHIKDRRQ